MTREWIGWYNHCNTVLRCDQSIYFKEVSIMALVTSKEMFRKAYDGGYAIGAFNVNNMEIVQGIT